MAVDPSANRLYGANWDTKRIYIWDTSGRLIRSASSADLKSSTRIWLPAVQDWKSIGPGRVLLGGLAKTPGSQPSTDQSVLEVWDLDSLTRVRSIRVPRPKGFTGEVANEGCAVWKGRVYFLPDDLGGNAAIQVFLWADQPPDPAP